MCLEKLRGRAYTTKYLISIDDRNEEYKGISDVK